MHLASALGPIHLFVHGPSNVIVEQPMELLMIFIIFMVPRVFESDEDRTVSWHVHEWHHPTGWPMTCHGSAAQPAYGQRDAVANQQPEQQRRHTGCSRFSKVACVARGQGPADHLCFFPQRGQLLQKKRNSKLALSPCDESPVRICKLPQEQLGRVHHIAYSSKKTS
jgi:hypothetical protein